MGHAEVQTTARQTDPGAEVARHRSTSPAHLVRALVPLAFYPTPDCGSRMTGDRHVRFCESGRGKLPPATRQAAGRRSWVPTRPTSRRGAAGVDDDVVAPSPLMVSPRMY